MHVRGFTLVELLVGILVASLVSMAALSSANFMLGRQRQSVSATGSQAALVTALGAIKAEVSSAGLGFSIDGAFRCASLNAHEGSTVLLNGASFAPLAISRAAGTRFDALSVAYATDINGMAPVRLAENAAPNASSLKLRSWLPAGGKKILLSAEDGIGVCTLRTVESTVENAGNPIAPWSLNLVESPAFAGPVEYAANSTITVLGDVERRTIAVSSGGRLLVTSSAAGGEAELVENVVAFRAQYGVVPAGGTTVQWVDPVGAWASVGADDLRFVRAIRFGVVARSPQREKECVEDMPRPQLFGETFDLGPADPSWNCFRYRQAEVVVPLRNTAWSGVPT